MDFLWETMGDIYTFQQLSDLLKLGFSGFLLAKLMVCLMMFHGDTIEFLTNNSGIFFNNSKTWMITMAMDSQSFEIRMKCLGVSDRSGSCYHLWQF